MKKHGKAGTCLSLFSIAAAMAALMWFAVSANGLSGLLAALAGVDARWLGFAFATSVLYWFFEALVLQALTQNACSSHKFKKSMHTGLVGLFYNAITPFATGGQPMQMYVMSKGGMDIGTAGSILVTKSIIYQTCLTAIAIVSVIFGAGFFHPRVPLFSVFVAAGLAINLLAVAVMHALSSSSRLAKIISRAVVSAMGKAKLIKRPGEILRTARRQIRIFHDRSSRFGKNLPIKALSYALTLMQFAAYYSIPFCIYKSFGLSGAPILLMLCAQSIIAMITAFVPLPGSSVAAEGSFYIFFSIFFNAAAIVPAMLVWRFFTYYLNIIAGGIVWALGMARRNA
jgi:uncharacterized protein (TIRG00374 family)